MKITDEGVEINVSDTCEQRVGVNGLPDNWGQSCGRPATCGYPAMGGGFAMLCEEHGRKHANITQPIEDIRAGVPHPWSTKQQPKTHRV